jgi:hypothetical protein
MYKTLGMMVGMMILAFGNAVAANSSQYTDLDKCKLLEANEQQEWSRELCKGLGGYELERSEGDLRQSITVILPNKKDFPLEFWNISAGFSTLGNKAEWRGAILKGKFVPSAIIVRFNVSENPEDSSKITSYLIVAKLGPKPCITHKILGSKVQNLEARAAADVAIKTPCMRF